MSPVIDDISILPADSSVIEPLVVTDSAKPVPAVIPVKAPMSMFLPSSAINLKLSPSASARTPVKPALLLTAEMTVF